MSELRELFIAVLGHDLRNPIASIDAGIARLLKEGWTGRSSSILHSMKASVGRTTGLINNVMDFTRARLGGGITLERTENDSLEGTLNQVVEELRSSHPDRVIETTFRFVRTVSVDHARIGQMLSNLLGNALTHGAPDQAVHVYGKTVEDRFDLAVSNGGEAIAAETMDRLFQPFRRGDGQTSPQGLGLGLYIASEIASAHGGRIDVASDQHETRFTFQMPLSQ